MRLKQGMLELPDGVSIQQFMQADGKAVAKPKATTTFGQLRDAYVEVEAIFEPHRRTTERQGRAETVVNHIDFSARFPESTQIGCDITDDEVACFFDNGNDVGWWRIDRRSTCGSGEILDIENSHIARLYYREKQKRAANDLRR